MEKEDVLEVEFIPVWDNNFVWKITKQNEDILKIGDFKDSNLNVYSISNYDYIEDNDTLYIKGEDTDYYYNCGVYKFCTLKEKKLIEEKVRLLNEKYAIKILWRAEKEESYYYVSDELIIEKDRDFRTIEDDRKYKNRNYFETEELAEEFCEKIKDVLKNNK